MIQGTGPISNYGNFISNCNSGQMPYKVPVDSLTDVQLFIDIGVTKPTAVLYELIHTCGPDANSVDTLATTDYVIGQTKDNLWYGVFKNFTGSNPQECFVIAITLTFGGSGSITYFSEEFCKETCTTLTELKGCYGNLASDISTDCNGIYFGQHAGTGTALGNTEVTYQHQIKMRSVEVTLASIKNTFKQGRTRNFRTEKEKVFQFWSEFVPEWYLPEVDAVFNRGEVFVGSTKYLVNETTFEKVDECYKRWKPSVTFHGSCFQSFSCEGDPCAPPPEPCCDPEVTSAYVTEVTEQPGGSSGSIPPPPIIIGTIVIEAVVGGALVVSGTLDAVTGISNGSSVITCVNIIVVAMFHFYNPANDHILRFKNAKQFQHIFTKVNIKTYVLMRFLTL